MKVFISQPMRDKTNEEIKMERNRAIEVIKAQYENEDIEFIDSFFEDVPHEVTPLWYLAKSLELMSTSDLVYFIKGWEEYRGCKIENAVAKAYGYKVIEE